MGRGRSTLVLFVLAVALGGYLYFVESKRTVPDENAKKKVFTSDAAKINQLQIKSPTGEVTGLRKGTNDTWTIVQPVEAPADRNGVSDIVTNLANLEEQREVDPNASDLKAYGLADPRIDVTFHLEGEKEPKRILLGDKTPGGTGVYAKLPAGNRVFLVEASLDTTLNKSTFDFRDKTALAFERKQSHLARACVGRTDDPAREDGRRLEARETASGTRRFCQRQRAARPVAVGTDDGAEGSAGGSQGSEEVRPRQASDRGHNRDGRIHREVRARHRSRPLLCLGAGPLEGRRIQRQQWCLRRAQEERRRSAPEGCVRVPALQHHPFRDHPRQCDARV